MDQDQTKEKEIFLNGKALSESVFQVEKENLEKKPGVTVVKISENNYKTKIKG